VGLAPRQERPVEEDEVGDVERHERPADARRPAEVRFVGRAESALLAQRDDVVPEDAKRSGESRVDVLVEGEERGPRRGQASAGRTPAHDPPVRLHPESATPQDARDRVLADLAFDLGPVVVIVGKGVQHLRGREVGDGVEDLLHGEPLFPVSDDRPDVDPRSPDDGRAHSGPALPDDMRMLGSDERRHRQIRVAGRSRPRKTEGAGTRKGLPGDWRLAQVPVV